MMNSTEKTDKKVTKRSKFIFDYYFFTYLFVSFFSLISESNSLTVKNAERERSRVKSLRFAFQSLQSRLPCVPPNTKLSKLDILILASNYINHLTKMLSDDQHEIITANQSNVKHFHPVKVIHSLKSLLILK